MNSKKIFFGMIALLVLAVGLIGASVFMGNSMLTKQASKLKELRLEAKLLEAQKSALVIAKKDLQQNKELGTIARSVVPQDKDQAKTVREIARIAEESGFEIKSVSFDASNLGTAAAPVKTTESGEAATATPAAPPLSQVKPVSGINGVYSLAIIVSPGGDSVTYSQFLTFLEKLERNRRTAHVEKVSITPEINSIRLRFTLTLNAYVKP